MASISFFISLLSPGPVKTASNMDLLEKKKTAGLQSCEGTLTHSWLKGLVLFYSLVGIKISYLPFFSYWLFVKIKQNHLCKTALWTINSNKRKTKNFTGWVCWWQSSLGWPKISFRFFHVLVCKPERTYWPTLYYRTSQVYFFLPNNNYLKKFFFKNSRVLIKT